MSADSPSSSANRMTCLDKVHNFLDELRDILDSPNRKFLVYRVVISLLLLLPIILASFSLISPFYGIPTILFSFVNGAFFVRNRNRVTLLQADPSSKENALIKPGRTPYGYRIHPTRSRNLRLVTDPALERDVWELHIWEYNELTKALFFLVNPLLVVQLMILGLILPNGSHLLKLSLFMMSCLTSVVSFVVFQRSEQRGQDKMLVAEEVAFVGQMFERLYRLSGEGSAARHPFPAPTAPAPPPGYRPYYDPMSSEESFGGSSDESGSDESERLQFEYVI